MQSTLFSAFCAGICHKSWAVYTALELCTETALVLVVLNHEVLVQGSCLLRLCYMSNCNRICSIIAKDSCNMENEFISSKIYVKLFSRLSHSLDTSEHLLRSLL